MTAGDLGHAASSVTEIVVEGDRLAATHVAAGSDALAGPGGAPVVVMGHGLGGTQDSGLMPFARALARAGTHVLTFDYRGFGLSGGQPRQVVSAARQLADYRAALEFARTLPGVDPARVALWGESLSGGTVVAAAAGRGDIAAVVSMVPLLSGPAAARLALTSTSPVTLARTTALGARAALARRGTTMPLVGRPGEAAALTQPGHREDYLALAGPSWRNEVGAGVAAEIAAFRPGALAKRLRCPWLVQIAQFDRVVPARATAAAAARGRATVHRYPCDHFGTQAGQPFHDLAVRHQIAFLTRTLAVRAP